ncbi:uncharacterized protein LOC109721091 [Ananas comosus]|uniref:Uncharacterized protein LOC109721091 n=1 Tax=Ananas comosus TaxID=4615 RepID=A0A6P5G681_ANACO|nr:uncharacterized protein LOC109721091 [Ananas comosus]
MWGTQNTRSPIPPLISRGMLGKLSASPFRTFETSAFSFFSSHDVSNSTRISLLPMRAEGVKPYLRPNLPSQESHNSSYMLRNSSYMHRSWKIRSFDQAQVTILEDDEKKIWEESKQILSGLNFSADEADRMLKKAFGWVHSPYWSEERKTEIPKIEIVNEILDYIRSLGLSDEDLHKLLKKFPEVLGCSLDNEVKANVGTLEKEWGIKGKALRNLLLRNPKVLGYNVDCRGDCMAKCTRCWVRF